MNGFKYIFFAFMLAFVLPFGTKAAAVPQNDLRTSTSVAVTNDIELINKVYGKFVFAVEPGKNAKPEDYFTNNALKRLQQDYEFDCGEAPCYAYYALRTSHQDSKPESDGRSRIDGIEPVGEGWYIVSYSDMGWPGKTRIKMADGKIDMYEPLEP